MKKCIIIGGGAAGMFAAITAASEGIQVSLWEKNEKLGKKLFITGKGRCNLCLLYTSLPNHKIFLTIIKAIKNILFHSQVKCCVGRRGFKKNHNSTSVLFCMIY